jgi:PKD repeat protein
MLRRLSVVALGVFLAGCHGIEPGPASPSLTSSGSGAAPTAIAIVISPGELPIGGGTADVLISTTAGGGSVVAPLVPVHLSVDGGALSAADVTTDDTGHATVTWTGTTRATVTAVAGALSHTAAIIVIEPRTFPPDPGSPAPPPGPAPTPPPAPPPPPPPPPPVPSNGVTATFSVSPQQPTAGEPATFMVTVSSRPDSPVVAYAWDFTDDGQTDSTAAAPIHTFPSNGRQLVSIKVTVADGRTATDVGGVTVGPAPTPTVLVTLAASPTTGGLGDTIAFTASASSNPTAGPVTSYVWEFGAGGGATQTTASPNISTTYSTIGSKTVRVTANTANGTTGTATTPVSITAPDLVVGITPSGAVGPAPTSVTFTANVTSTGPVPTGLTYGWDWDNNGTVDEVRTTNPTLRSYNQPGTHTVRVTVTSPDGRTATNTTVITVS